MTERVQRERRLTGGSVVRLWAIVLFTSTAAGCSLAAGIFKAGFWVGLIFAVVLLISVRILFRGRR